MRATPILVSNTGTHRVRPVDTGPSAAMMFSAVLAAIMMLATLLAPVNTQSIVESINSTVGSTQRSAADQSVIDQMQRVGDGVALPVTGASTFDSRFMLSGPVFAPSEAAQFSIVTTSLQGESLLPAEPALVGDRVTYTHGSTTEWWVRNGSGYEQGWTIAEAPADGSTALTVDVSFANAAPLQISPTEVELILGDGSRAWYRDLHAFDAEGTVLPAEMTVDGSNVHITVDATGATYPVTIDPIVAQDQQLIPPDSTTGDLFGEAVATDGDHMIVSVRGADRNVADQGRAEIYKWNGTGWDFQSELLSPVLEDTNFAWDVDINIVSGHAVVGAPNEDTNGTDAGAVHVFVDNNDGTWSFQQTIYECDPAGGDCGETASGNFGGSQFGKAVAIADDGTIAVGAPGAFGTEGRVYIYQPIGAGGEWLTSATRVITATTGLTPGDRQGASVDISADGTFIVSGVPGNPTGDGSDNGTVHLSGESTPGTWISLDGDNGPSANQGQEHGASVAIDLDSQGNHIVVAGRPFRTREDEGDSGAPGIRVYRVNGTPAAATLNTVALGDISGPTNDGFGFSVAYDTEQDVVLVGSPFNAGAAGNPERGLVRSYQYDPVLNVMDPAQLDLPSDWPTSTGINRYGYAVAEGPPGIDESYVTGSPGFVSTTPRRSPQSGRVTTSGQDFGSVFTETPNKSAAAHDQLGWAVAVNETGTRMASSAIGDDERSPLNGIVYAYERASEEDPWALAQLIVDPTPTDDAKPFGWSLDMEGPFLIIGSPGGDGEAAIFGHNGTSWAYRDSILGDAASFNSLAPADFQFGTDVAISSDGAYAVVTAPAADAPACGDCGGYFVYRWTGVDYVPMTGITNPSDASTLGLTVDLDDVPGDADLVRVVVGRSGAEAGVLVDNISRGLNTVSNESVIALAMDARSIALDGNRMIVGDADATDSVVIGDFPGVGETWQGRFLTNVLLGGAAPTPLPNNFVDVSGDTAVVGRFPPGGGEVGVYYNDPSYGWGIVDANAGWAPGPFDQIQPTVQNASHNIARAVAIDGTGSTKSIVFGADGRDTNGVNAGVVYAKSFTEAGAPAPANKITTGSAASNRFGSEISMQGSNGVVPARALMSEENDGARAHYMIFTEAGWSIQNTFTFVTAVEDVDLAPDGKAAVLLRNGTVVLYQENCVGPTCDLVATGTTGTGAADVGSSVSISGNEVNVAGPSPTAGDRFSGIFFSDGSNSPVGAPGGITDADLFGTDMDSSGALTVIGAPGSGDVYVWDNSNMSYRITISAPALAVDFGESVAMSGNTIVVGAPGTDLDGSVDGVVYVYEYDGTFGAEVANLVATLEPSAGSGLSTWGASVDIDDDLIVIGGTGYEESGIPFRDGSAVAFGFNGDEWLETDRFDHTDDANGDNAGEAVAAAGDFVLVGVPGDDNPLGQDAGAVYSYTASASPDAGPANRLISNNATSSGFGRHIDIDGTVAAVAEHNDGAVQIYDLVGADWVFRQRIADVGGAGGSIRDLSLDGNRLAVVDRIGNDLVLFEEVGGVFTQVDQRSVSPTAVPESVVLDGDDIFVGSLGALNDLPLDHQLWAGGSVAVPALPGSADAGWSIAKEGDLVFVGARFWDNTPDDNAGRVHIYDTSTQTWTGILVADQPGSFFGSDLATSNGRLVVGYEGGEGPDATPDPGPTADTGIVEVYNNLTPTGATLEQVVAGSNQDTADGFGRKVDIDGDVIAVGAPATSYNGVRRGQVVTFTYDGVTWSQANTFRSDADSTGTDGFGHDVAISGLSVIAGAFQHDNSRGTDAGAAYTFFSSPPGAPDAATITFDMQLAPGSPTSVDVAPSGIAVADFDREILEDAAEDGTSIASASVGAANLEDTPITSLDIGDTPITSLATDPTSVLGSIPLIEINLGVEGGWQGLFDAAGSSLGDVPLNNLTLADVYADGAAAAALNSTSIVALDISGTPITSLPITSLVLGGLTLDQLSTAVDWCSILAGFIDGTCDPTAITLFEASISGVPITSLPITSLPITSLPITSLPLEEVPITSLDLDASPITSLPITSLPITSLPITSLDLADIPITSLDLAGLPITSLPITSLNLGGTPITSLPITSLPITSLKLRDVPITSLPITSLPITSLPITSLPITSLYVAEVPLVDLPISSLETDATTWCEVLEEVDAGYDCSFAADDATFLANTTIIDLGIRGVPITSLPITSLPITSLPITSLGLDSLPITSLPITSLPITSLPITSLDLAGTPITSLTSVGATNLSEVPITSLDVLGSRLSSVPITSLPITSLPITSLPITSLPITSLPITSLELNNATLSNTPITSLPITSLDLADTPIGSLPITSLPITSLGIDCTLVDCGIDTLNDAVLAGAIDGDTVTIAQLQPYLSGIRLSDIADDLLVATRQDVIDALLASTLTLDQLLDLDDMTLGDLPQGNALVGALTLADLSDVLWQIRFSDLVGALIDPSTGEPFSDADVETTLNDFIATFTGDGPDDLLAFGDATLGDLLEGNTSGLNFDALGPILRLVHTDEFAGITGPSGNLGDLTPEELEELGGITLLDLIGIDEADDMTLEEFLVAAQSVGLLEGFTVNDLIVLLVGVDAVPFSNLDFTEVETGALPDDVVPAVSYVASFEVDDTTSKKAVEVEVLLPGTASYVPGSGTATNEDPIVVGGEPTVVGNTLRWSFTGIDPGDKIDVQFKVKPTVTIGSTILSGTARIVGSDASTASNVSIEVTEGTEPNDFPATTAINENSVYLTYISTPTDHDVFEITIQDNDELAIQLSSLSSDLDVVLYGAPTDTSVNAALTDTSDEAPLEPITDPDQDGADSEPLQDFRRLDEEDSSLSFIDISNSPGTETELLVTDPLPAGTYYVQVFGANGATNVDPAALQVQILEADDRPECAVGAPITGANGTAPALAGSTANTLILVNQQRTSALFGAVEWAALDSEIDDLVNYLNINTQLEIDPIVVPVDGIGDVRNAYAAWDADPDCSPESANAVVSSIIENVIDPLRPTLEHVVIVGGDQVIPMARLLDVTTIANEYDFRYEFIGDNAVGGDADEINQLSASFWDRQYLSDEPYGESSARDLGNRYLYVSDIALGRMVETPAEIIGQLQHFQDFDGALDADTAAVLGYDFLVDSSAEISADLAAAGVGTVDDDLADGFVGAPAGGDKWDRIDAENKLLAPGGAPDLISLNGHFDHYRALPADGDQVPDFNDNLLASTIAGGTPGLLSGSIVFSMGCHGGLSVADTMISATNGDWAQTFAADQAIFIGNTGFGYGDSEAVAYTEKLMALFAEQAVRPVQVEGTATTTTIGQALTFAKNEYAADLSVFSVYDEKALMESTFYGLPFYRVGATAIPAAPLPTNTTAPDSTGIESVSLTALPQNNLEVTDRGSIYSNPDEDGDPQVIVAPGMPIQPSQSVDVSVVDAAGDTTVLDQVAHGALVVDMTSSYTSPVDPVVSTAVFNESDDQPEPKLGNVVFPAKPASINTTFTPGGNRQTLVLATGQFDSDGLTQRLDSELDVVVYYADPAETDFEAPAIGVVESTLEDGVFTVSLSAVDEAGVDRVYVLFGENPGSGTVEWEGIDLANTPGSDEWSGSLIVDAGTTEVEFLVQAVDAVGNVAVATNKARNFNDDGIVESDPPSPDLTVTVDNANLVNPPGWHTQSVDVTVDSGDLEATYTVLPGGTPTALPSGGGTFTVSGEGVNTWTVTTSDGQSESGTIRIDTQAPTASIAPPTDGDEYAQSFVPGVSFICQDPSLVSCSATADGTAIELGDPLPNGLGSHTVNVTATDVLGASASATATYTVVADPTMGDAPIIIDAEVDGVALPGEAVDVTAEFIDGTAPFTVSIDWGNGDSCPGDGTCEVMPPELGMNGLVWGSYTYPAGGSFDVVITVTDANGLSSSATVTTATCTIVGTNGDNGLLGTNGDDVICGRGGDDFINGRGGDDIIYAGAGNDVVVGRGGEDVIFGGRGNDRLVGGGDDDTLIGGQGNDRLIGGDGNDTLKGRRGIDRLFGDRGDDLLFGNRDRDWMFGGDGIDLLRGGRADDKLYGNHQADEIRGGSGDDQIYGGSAADIISGGAGEDRVWGGSGADIIDGGDDDDILRGNSGNDAIEGGLGDDLCRGNGGTDTIEGCEF